VSTSSPSRALLTGDPQRAADCLRAGGLAVLPTETVYGLGALADRRAAVARVYATKGRPADHPLIVHLAAAAELPAWSVGAPVWAATLSQECWPGPLTLVVPRSPLAADHVTAGQPTVALRVPDHPLALEALRQAGGGVAAPSANRFGRVSPTSAAHVLHELGDLLDPDRDCVLDGGACAVGVESTILDCTGPVPRLLRPGAVSAHRVTELTGLPVAHADGTVRAPGTLAAHYAPSAQVVVVAAPRAGDPQQDPVAGLIAPAPVGTPPGVVRLLAPVDERHYAAGLYAALREADVLGLRRVEVVLPAAAGPGPAARGGLVEAITDRVRRAAVGSGGAHP
jgi:L-threonylcarbamoyladenylate synthase